MPIKKIHSKMFMYCIMTMIFGYHLYHYKANKKSTPTIFCLIITKIRNLDTHTQIIYDSWAHKCDDHRFITLIPGQNKSEILEENFKEKLKLLKPNGLIIDKYNLLTYKVFRMFIDAYKYYNKYDWYLKPDDDTFIFYDNLKLFLSDKNPKLPITFGRDFQMAGGYHSGGAGYLLSSEALKRMATKLIKNFTSCPVSGYEDLDVGACWRSANVTWSKSLDEFKKERFFPQPLLEFYHGSSRIDWLHTYGANKLFRGFNCCSDSLISYHKVSVTEMKALSEFIKSKSNFKFLDVAHFLIKFQNSSLKKVHVFE